jgi:hypothetical protein
VDEAEEAAPANHSSPSTRLSSSQVEILVQALGHLLVAGGNSDMTGTVTIGRRKETEKLLRGCQCRGEARRRMDKSAGVLVETLYMPMMARRDMPVFPASLGY